MSSFFDQLKQNRDNPRENVKQRSSSNFFSYLKKKRELPQTFDEEEESGLENFRNRVRKGYKDVAEQSGVGLVSGFGGAYGNLLNLVGLNPEEGYINPGEKAKYEVESQILEKMAKPGYKPSVSEIYALSDDDIAPQFSRLPTSAEIARKIEDIGGPGEALTPEGNFARRASEIFGGGAAFGATGALPALAGAAGGEIAKYAGAGPIGQTVAEIASIIASQGKSLASNPLTSKNPKVLERIKELRKAGLSDKEITLAVNAHKASLNRTERAKVTNASSKSFSEALGKSERLFNEVLEKSFPGFEHGTDFVHEVASDAYGKVARASRGIKIKDPSRFDKVIENVTQRVQKNLGENTDAKPFLERLKTASEHAQLERSAESYINFYKELNKMGKWANPKDREKFITHVKNGIKSTFRNSGPEGKKLAEDFERVNKGIQRAYQAEDVSDLISKASTQEGIDWKKMLKLFDKKSTWETLKKGVGKEQAKNLHRISKAAQDIGSLEKALGSKNISTKGGNEIKNLGVLWSLFSHNAKYAAIGYASKFALKGSKNLYARLQTKLLTDPKFQNLSLKAIQAVKNGSPRSIQRVSDDFQKFAEEEGIDLEELY